MLTKSKQYLSWYSLKSKYELGRKVLDMKNGLLLCSYHNQHNVGIYQHAERTKLHFLLDSSLNLNDVHAHSVFLMIQNKTFSLSGEI